MLKFNANLYRIAREFQMNQEGKRSAIIRKHYGLKRALTPLEVRHEINNLYRRGLEGLDDSQRMLAAALALDLPVHGESRY